MGGRRTQRPHREPASAFFGRPRPRSFDQFDGRARGSKGLSICFSLRWARILSTTTGSVITATTVNSSPQRSPSPRLPRAARGWRIIEVCLLPCARPSLRVLDASAAPPVPGCTGGLPREPRTAQVRCVSPRRRRRATGIEVASSCGLRGRLPLRPTEMKVIGPYAPGVSCSRTSRLLEASPKGGERNWRLGFA